MRLTIKTKLIATFIILIIFMVGVYILGVSSLSNMNDKVNNIADVTASKIKLAARINQDILFISREEKNLILAKDDQTMDDIVKSIDKKTDELDERLESLKAISDQEDKLAIEDFEDKWDEYIATFSNVASLTRLNSNTKATKLAQNEAKVSFAKTTSIVNEIISTERKSGTSGVRIYDIASFQNIINNLVRLEKDIILASTTEEMNDVEKDLEHLEKELDLSTIDVKRMLSAKSAILFSKLEIELNNYLKLSKEIRRLTKENGNKKAFELSSSQGRILHDQATTLMASVVSKSDSQLTIDKEESDGTYGSSNTSMLVLIIVAILICSGLAFWVIQSITKSLKIAKNAVNKVADGDFSEDIEIVSEDEIGDLLERIKLMVAKLRGSVKLAKNVADGDLTKTAEDYEHSGGELDKALTDMVLKLREVVGSILNGAENIASASEQLSTSSQQLSQGSQEQAASSEQVSSSMEQMTANIQQNTENALQTEKISKKTAINTKDSDNAVSETIDNINIIAKKISIIGEIADKTDLLALNAAVEAARAGEHGKGFAVVASEVRKLAERSQKAAADIEVLSSKGVESGIKSGELLKNVVPDIEKTAELVQEISAASREQNDGAEQVNGAIQQLSQVIQQNASSSEEIASSAEVMSTQASELKAIINYFRLNRSNDTHLGKQTNIKKVKSSEGIGPETPKNKGFEIDMQSGEEGNDYIEFEN